MSKNYRIISDPAVCHSTFASAVPAVCADEADKAVEDAALVGYKSAQQ